MKAKRILAGLALASAAGGAAAQSCDDNDRWQCCALFCMLNPNGPTAVAQCVSPISKLKQAWRRGHSVSCPGMDVGTTPVPFDPCPPGTAQAAPGQIVRLVGSPAPAVGGYVSAPPGTLFREDSVDVQRGTSMDDSSTTGHLRVCVAGDRGTVREASDPAGSYEVTSFDRVYLQPRQTEKPFLISVRQQDGTLYQYRYAAP